MNSLSPEILLSIFDCVQDKADLQSCQLVSSKWNALSLSAAYRTACVHESNASALTETLAAFGAAGRGLLHGLAVSRHLRSEAGEWASIQTQVLPLLQPRFCSNMASLSFQWRDLFVLDDGQFWGALQQMPRIHSFCLNTGYGAFRGGDIMPCLSLWSRQLRHLEISGLYCRSSEELTDVPSLDQLHTLKLDQFAAPDDVFTSLFGNSTHLKHVSLFLGATNMPTEAATLKVLEPAASTITHLELYKPWSELEDRTFGPRAVQLCKNLEHLVLHGQIYTPELFSLPVLKQLTTLDLQWYSAIAFQDVSTWLRACENPRLNSLRLMCECYEQDVGQDALYELMDLAVEKGIGRRSMGCVFGCVHIVVARSGLTVLRRSWQPPLAPPLRRVSGGMVDN
jgi:hypothetical protein